MSLQDILRRETQDIRDALDQIERRYRELHGRRDAAQERLNRAIGEIGNYRKGEADRKRVVGGVDKEVADIQARLEEVERQRAELFDLLLEKRAEREKTEGLLEEARKATEKAHALVREARPLVEETGRELEGVERERERNQVRRREACLRALDAYVSELAQRIEQILAGQAERGRRMATAASLKRARHEDRQIADLCDQRDQFKEIMVKATVPGVKDTLVTALRGIEEELERRYPGALSAEGAAVGSSVIEELHYFIDTRGKGVILLPVSESVWSAIRTGEGGARVEAAMRIIWGIVKGIGLEPQNGEFRWEDGHSVFVSHFDEEEMSVLDSLNVTMPGEGALTFRVSPVPSEVQEALSYGATND